MSNDEKLQEQLPNGDGRGTNKQAEYWSNVNKTARVASDQYDSDIYFYSGGIFDDGYSKLVGSLSNNPRQNVLLILVTNGGSANTAYQIARLLQKTYVQFSLYAPSYCKSAGTIVALGANRLIMDDFSELGPLDVQLQRKDELWDTRSGLISRSAFRSLTEASFDMYQQTMMQIKVASRNQISFRLASETAQALVGQLMSPIYGQLNPESIGSDFRDLEVALEYGIRLARQSGNADFQSVHQLVNKYPSHDFIIDDDEARTLFRFVDRPTDELYALLGCLGLKAFDEAQEAEVYQLGEEEHDHSNDTKEDVADDEVRTKKSSGLDSSEEADQQSDPRAPPNPEGAKNSRRRRKQSANQRTNGSFVDHLNSGDVNAASIISTAIVRLRC